MRRRNTSAGFVLLDALVAFAIAALALTAILAALPNTSVRHMERLDRHLATEFAFSMLEEYRVTFPVMPPEGEDPTGWSWSISESAAQTEAQPTDNLLQYVEVTVLAWHRDRPDVRSTLQAIIARRRE